MNLMSKGGVVFTVYRFRVKLWATLTTLDVALCKPTVSLWAVVVRGSLLVVFHGGQLESACIFGALPRSLMEA